MILINAHCTSSGEICVSISHRHVYVCKVDSCDNTCTLKMPQFLEAVESSFGTRDLYEALGIEKSAESKVIRKAYHRLSLQVHPDRVTPEDVEQATRKFQVCKHTAVYFMQSHANTLHVIAITCEQVLGKIYAILSDSDKRAIYDKYGTVDEDDDSIFKQVSTT